MSIVTHVGAPAGRAYRTDPPAPIRARVKWFNVEKGFGFVVPMDGSADAFLHAATLSRCGIGAVPEGAEVTCEIATGEKGPQVVRVLDAVLPADEPAAELDGSVKWFSPDKGFGFVLPDDRGRDVFLHKSVLRRAGLTALDQGRRVRVRAVDTPRGREAVEIIV